MFTYLCMAWNYSLHELNIYLMSMNKILIYMYFFHSYISIYILHLGISCCLCLHTNGQLTQAGPMGLGEVEGLWQDLCALAVLFRLRGRLHSQLRTRELETDNPRWFCHMCYGVFQNCTFGRWRGNIRISWLWLK